MSLLGQIAESHPVAHRVLELVEPVHFADHALSDMEAVVGPSVEAAVGASDCLKLLNGDGAERRVPRVDQTGRRRLVFAKAISHPVDEAPANKFVNGLAVWTCCKMYEFLVLRALLTLCC